MAAVFRNFLLRRMLSAVIGCCLLLSVCPALSEADDIFPFSDRFGYEAIVTTDSDGSPMLVNGFPFCQAVVSYYDIGQMQNYEFTVDFLDYPFWQSSTVYDGNLAVMSLAMALSASRPVRETAESGEVPDPSENLRIFLTNAGFTDIRTDDYSKETSMYTVSTGIGLRRMEADGREPFTLIAVGICGGNYNNEWQSNMTPGTGSRHEGFEAASRLVIDRLAGYIAMRNIKGKIKVWISGFSRAAAVTNLTAATISDTGMVAKEDIYAYTFATPAAVKDPPAAGYDHIFNIICPTDLIPQVMPYDWGYGRFGTDLYLAVKEFSSFWGQINTAMRADLDKTKYAVVNNYSPELNFRMRILFSLLQDELQSLDHYNTTFQPAVVGLMQNKTLPNMASTLRRLMVNLQGSSATQRVDTDELMDFFARLYFSGVYRTGLGPADRNSATVMYRLFNEHNENSYLANASAIRASNFESSTESNYVMIRGPVTVSLFFSDNPENVLLTMASGSQSGSSNGDGKSIDSEFFYVERSGNTTILAVPGDFDYTVAWTAEKSGTVEYLSAGVSVHASSVYPGYYSTPVTVRAGDTGTAYIRKNGQLMIIDGMTAKSFDGRDLAEFANIASLGISWRLALTVFFALFGLFLTGTFCIFFSRNSRRKNQYSFFCWFMLCLFGIGILESEVAYWFFADRPLILILWKLLIAVCLVFLYFRVHAPKPFFRNSLLPGLLLALAGDIVLLNNVVPGIAFFQLGRLSLIIFFLRRKSMSRGKWIQWAVTAIPLAALFVLRSSPEYGLWGWFAAVCVPVLLLLVFCSAGEELRLRIGAGFLALSDLLLVVYTVWLNEPAVHVLYIFFFYISLLLLAVSASKTRQAPHGSVSPDPLPDIVPENIHKRRLEQ